MVLQEGSTSYFYGHGLISQVSGTNQTWFLADGLGSTAALTDSQGDITATYKYDVFGAVRSNTGPGSTDFRFAGQQDDSTLSYQYLRARYYDPAIGRFISKDPLKGIPTVPITQDPYPYAANNPINMTDPTGEIGLLAAFGLGAVVGGISSFVSSAANGARGMDLFRSTVRGAVAGGLTTLALSPLGNVGQVIGGTVAGALGSYVGQATSGSRTVNWGLVAASGFGGAAGSMGGLALTVTRGVGAGIIGSGAIAGLFDTWLSIFGINHQTVLSRCRR